MGMKFIRGMIYPNANSGGRGVAWRLKWTYEFWGFCINGTASPTVPGGFAANNGVNFPANFTGGTSLLHSGTDGSHPAISGDLFSGDCVFTSASANFTTAVVGKALVMWKPNSNSSEDSIYVITRVINSNQIMININTGGTPNVTTKHPSMTARTGVNYRVVDMTAATDAGYINGAFMVLETDASSVNSGQANSQIMFTHQAETHSNTSNYGNTASAWVGVGLSGTGSWNGTPLTITSTTGAGVSPIVITTASPHGYTTGQTVNIHGVAGNTNCNGMFVITVTGPTTFALSNGLSGGSFPVPGTTMGNGSFMTTIAAGSNGVSLPTGTINVASTTGFESSSVNGAIFVTTSNGVQTVNYTSTNGTQFLGCTGGTGTMSTGNAVTRLAQVWNGFQNDGYAGMVGINPNTSQAYTGGQTAVTMIGDKTFLLAHIREQDLFQINLYYWFHFEIPTRLYPEGVDKHPIAYLYNVASSGPLSTSAGYGTNWIMRTHSSDIYPMRYHPSFIKSLFGDGTLSFPTYSDSGGGQGTFGGRINDYRIGYNTVNGTVPMSDALLGLYGVANQFSLGRVRLRSVKFTGIHVPRHHRIGLNGEFIQLYNGICWPWDNTIIPHQLTLFGN